LQTLPASGFLYLAIQEIIIVSAFKTAYFTFMQMQLEQILPLAMAVVVFL
jgi:hypothetical protein